MYRVIIKRSVSALITLFCATLVLFVLIRLAPGDPVEIFLGRPGDLAVSDPAIYRQRVEEMRSELGLNQNVVVQYAQWIKRLANFDLGTSIYSRRAVAVEITERVPATMALSLAALAVQSALGVTFGIVSAVKAGKLADNLTRFVCVVFASVPAFVTALILLSFFAVTHRVYEMGSDANLRRLWLPAITLGIVGAPQLVRMVRTSMLSEFGKTYIVSAMSRGLSKLLIIRHALRNALLPISTMLALSFTTLIGGSVVIESIFSWPGIGNYAMNSVLYRDYPVIQGYTVVMVGFVILINLLVDLGYAFADPQVRTGVAKEERI